MNEDAGRQRPASQSESAEEGPPKGTVAENDSSSSYSRSHSQMSSNSSGSSVAPTPSQSLQTASATEQSETPLASPAPTASTASVSSNSAEQSAGKKLVPTTSATSLLLPQISSVDPRLLPTPKKRKNIFHNAFVGSYRSRCSDFRKIFKEPAGHERLLCDYACAFHSDILLQGRMYISLGFVCFYAKILGFETKIALPYKDVLSIVKEKTALVIPNAIRITVSEGQKAYFFTSFTARDRTFDILHRLWQNSLQNKSLSANEFWHAVHALYGPNVDFTATEEDYTTYLEFIAASSLNEPLILCDLLSQNQNQRVLLMKQQNLLNRNKHSGVSSGSKAHRKNRAKDEQRGIAQSSKESDSKLSKVKGVSISKTQDQLVCESVDAEERNKEVPRFALVGSNSGVLPQLQVLPVVLQSNSSDEIETLSDEDMHYQDCFSDPESFCCETAGFVCRVETDDMNTLRPSVLLLGDVSRVARSRSASRKHTLKRALTAEHSPYLEVGHRPVCATAEEFNQSSFDETLQSQKAAANADLNSSGNGDSCSVETPAILKEEHCTSDSETDSLSDIATVERKRHESQQSDTCYCTQHEHFDLALLDQPVALPVTYLFDCLTNANSRVFADLYNIKKHKDFVAEPWNDLPPPQSAQGRVTAVRRTIRYIRTVDMPGIRTTSRVTEEHTSFTSQKANPRRGIYYVLVIIRNAGIPYAESFHVEQQCCLRPLDASSSHLIVTARHRFDKEVGFMKGLISRSCESGIRDSFKHWTAKLTEEANRYRLEQAALPTSLSISDPKISILARQPTEEITFSPVRLRRSKRIAPDQECAQTIAADTPVLDEKLQHCLPAMIFEPTPITETIDLLLAPPITIKLETDAKHSSFATRLCEPFNWLLAAIYTVCLLFWRTLNDGLVSKQELSRNRYREATLGRFLSNVCFILLIMVVVALVLTNYVLHTKLSAIERLLIELRNELERSRNSLSS